ncbi:hypothetical protein AK812_SmicGene19193 [Symbiodinium microadriaticum]|uniref:Uncharacterized protein n=1 Tax=Symbiodinium microadriaticum TaxID=2951 RepID=A0A1Q9DT60_SYMMI|nr:hypothetical protein AK812_SmicGene19193 [Symbiodinium microadriaticum]CAE7668442.1 unnamed protein product [Symbiodinium sp. KB8]
MCLRALHAIYAILRNGLWDDPAEAVSGTIHSRFKKVAESNEINEDGATYLTWRFSYLICHVLFAAVWGAASYKDYIPRRRYDDIISQLPSEIQPKRFETFVVMLSWWDPFLMYVWCISFFLVLCALVTAAPPLAVRYARLSRRLVWSSWLWNFVLPFTVLLVYPLREAIDWNGVREDLCVVVVTRALTSPGIDISSALGSLQPGASGLSGLESLQTAVQEQLSQDVRMNDVPVRTWCQEQGTDWQTIFCERVMHCVLRADQRCREEVCFGAPVAEQTNCQTRCLEYAKSSPRAVAVSFTQSMETECEEFQGSQQSSSSFNATSVLDSMGSGIPSECMDLALQQLQIFNTMADQQSSRSQDQCSFATLAVNNVDFIAGIFVGVEAGALLIPSALSVLGGLAESLYNLKALFPGHQEVPWVLILTAFESVPIYTAFLAVIQQLMGNVLLAVACCSFIFWILLPALTGSLSLKLKPGTEGRWKFYRRVWVEYGLRGPLLIAIGLAMSAFLRDTLGNELLENRDPLDLLFFSTLNYFARKTLTAVAGTDVMVSTFLQSRYWRSRFTAEERTINEDRMEALAPIILELHTRPTVDKNEIKITSSPEDAPPSAKPQGEVAISAMPEALAALALAKMSPAAAAMFPGTGDEVRHVMDQEFHIFPEQRQELFDQAKETIIAARSAMFAPDAAAASAASSASAMPAPEVAQQGVSASVLAAWTAFMEFTNSYFNCGNDKHFRSSQVPASPDLRR